MTAPLRVLIIDDSDTDAKLVLRALQMANRPVDSERVQDADSLRAALKRQEWDAIVCDWSMPQFSALAALALVKQMGLDVPFVIASGTIGEDVAVAGLRAGAHDYVLKGNLTRLVPAIEREIRDKKSRDARSFTDAALVAIMDCAPAFILAVDLEGRIQFINRVLPQFSKEQVIGTSWLQYLAPEEHAEQSARLKRIVLTGQFENYETNMPGPDGSTLCFSAHMGPMRLNGHIVGVVLVSQDITDLKRSQIELASAQRMAAVGTLASGIAHEINTPIQFVSDSVHFLREASDDIFALLARRKDYERSSVAGAAASEIERAHSLALEAEARADIPYLTENVPLAFERCVDGLERVGTIVRSMKEFAHPSQLEMEPSDLNRAIQATLTIARGEYKYVAELETDFGELPLVTCHVSDINQVVLNIVVNAAHAIADVNRVTGKLGAIRVRTRHEADHVVVSIADSGPGIPDHIGARIFEPFFTTKGVGEGTGQGLALAWAVVKKKHGGELRYASKPGEGTTFFIELPIVGKPLS